MIYIENHLKFNGKLDQIDKMLETYEKTWCDFVDTHEKYLDDIDGVKVREVALYVYSEQFILKHEFDYFIKLEKKGGNPGLSLYNKSCKSTSTRTGSSRMSSLSRRRERLGVAQLRVKQMARKHEIAQKMLQLQNESELLEAQMQREEAELGVSMCEQAIQEEREEELLDVDRQIIPDVMQGQSRNVHKSILPPNEASLDRAKYQLNPNNQAETSAVHSEFPVKPILNPSAAAYKTTVSNAIPVVEQRWQDNVNQCPQLSWDPIIASQMSFPSHSQTTTNHPHVSAVGSSHVNVPPTTEMSDNVDACTALVKALKQVVTTPKIEYMCFDGNPIKFPSFIHNFETCLEKNSTNEESVLQLLIQHCRGKAKEAIESCVNLPAEEGYQVAKDTLQESFGKPHIIAGAHIKMLIDLPNIRKADGSSLLEFSCHLDSTNRTLKRIGTQYVSDLDYLNTLKDLIRKLPVFLELDGQKKQERFTTKPRFANFLQFIKEAPYSFSIYQRRLK